MDTINKMCKSISNNYFITREKNHKSEGYHFHAIVLESTPPRKQWFKKGVHIHYQQLRHKNPVDPAVARTHVPHMQLTAEEKVQERFDVADEHPDELESYDMDILMRKHLPVIQQTLAMRPHVMRVLKYMEKEQEMPMQYNEYMLVIRGKNRQYIFPTKIADAIERH